MGPVLKRAWGERRFQWSNSISDQTEIAVDAPRTANTNGNKLCLLTDPAARRVTKVTRMGLFVDEMGDVGP